MKKNWMKQILELAFYLLLAVALTWFILTFIGQRTTVDGDSMNLTLEDGDELIIEKLSYRFSDPERFDVIVLNYYKTKDSEPVYYIKRIIGLPGEEVAIIDGDIYIDGEILEETYGHYQDGAVLGSDTITVLGDDEYFVLGDNRNNSQDSRSIGPINRKDIVGKAIFRLYPFEKLGTFE